MLSFRSSLNFALFFTLGLLIAGCPKKSTVTPEEEAPAQEETQKPEEAAPEPGPVEAPSLEIGTDYATAPALPPVRFTYMKAELNADSRAILKKNAAVLKAVLKAAPGAMVRVEGHCDERGTLEYNLALGQRRANALRDYYLSFGIPRAAVKTISYGEERPACHESSEDCWAQNRRGETSLKSGQPVKIPLSELPAE
jgi:peptidoglycan-associated lipoprotein